MEGLVVEIGRMTQALERIANALEEIACDEARAQQAALTEDAIWDEIAKAKEGEPSTTLPPFPLARIQERSADVQIMTRVYVLLEHDSSNVYQGTASMGEMEADRWYICARDAVIRVRHFAPLDIAAELAKAERGAS